MYHSKPVTSNQDEIHPRLNYVVQRHINSPYLKPFQKHNLKAFDAFLMEIEKGNFDYLILDSCCGTGMSSFALAKQNPSALVVGVDQSYVRLNKDRKGEPIPTNCLMLQANCEDIWRLCDYAGIRFKAHYILYPNPYPKSEHLQRRWHGHPAFPFLKDLAETTILRSNWKMYLDEFNQAWQCLTGPGFDVKELVVNEPLTLFECKYAKSGQVVYELVVTSNF